MDHCLVSSSLCLIVCLFVLAILFVSFLLDCSPSDMLLGIGIASVVKTIRRKADNFQFQVSVLKICTTIVI